MRRASAPEETRLIKRCVGSDNYGDLVENGLLRTNQGNWVEMFRHHMEPMFSRLETIPFRQYPEADRWLGQELAQRRRRFWEAAEELGK